MPRPVPLPADAFGDPFDLARLPLAREAAGYAVQRLDTDCLLDRSSGDFRPVRTRGMQPLFSRFEEAHAAASDWVIRHHPDNADHKLAIVPVGYDSLLERHVLIYGVLCGRPENLPENHGENDATSETQPSRRRRPQRP